MRISTSLLELARRQPRHIVLHLYWTTSQKPAMNIQLNPSGPVAVRMYAGSMCLDISKAIGSPANPS